MTTSALTGVWTLEAFRVEDIESGAQSEPFGPAPRGVIMFLPEGRMAAILTPGERPVPETDAERAAAFQRMIACSGPYRIEPPDRFVIDVDVAWFEPWAGSQQVRTFRITDDRLDIVSAPTRLPRAGAADAIVIATLSWRRERPGHEAALPFHHRSGPMR